MDKSQTIDELIDLIKLDIDAAQSYTQAIKNIDDASLREQLMLFRGDHERHITDLSSAVKTLGGQPPSYSPDFKGFFISGFTSLRSMTGTHGALEAMQTNEKLTNRTYADAVKKDFSANLISIIEKNYADEQRHLAAINSLLQAAPAAR